MGKKENIEMTNILLEAGTNEVEMVEFSIGDSLYGINVAKVQEIIRYPESIVEVPNSHSSLRGIINLREHVVPIIDLPKHLNKAPIQDIKASRIVVCEFNKFIVGFWVGSVARIHRLSWKQMETPSGLMTSGEEFVVAVVRLEERIILLLDFEKITAEISPECGVRPISEVKFTAGKVGFDRGTKTILIAEDSGFMRNMLYEYLDEAGYKCHACTNGQEAWDYVREFAQRSDFEKIENHVNLLISDIEMPQMDGLRLIRHIKEIPKLRNLPCVVFSSLITDELSVKCKSVGADAEITKPEIEGLIELVDKHVL